jgi:O-antigen ligase
VSQRALPLSPVTVIAAAFASSVLTGTAMARGVRPGIALAVGLCYVPLVLVNLPLGMVVWIPSVFLNAVSALDIGPNVAGILVLLGWVGVLATPGSRLPELVERLRGPLIAVGALVLWVLLSMAWAEESPSDIASVTAWGVAGAIFLVGATALATPRYLRLAAGAFVLGAVVSVAIGLAGSGLPPAASTGMDGVQQGRVVGGSGDPNVLAAGIVPAIALAAGLAAGARRALIRMIALLAIGILSIGLAATESRGGLVAAVVALVAALVVARRQRIWILASMLLVGSLLVGWFSVDPDGWSRVTDLSEKGSGRSELWTVAWQMWQDHPVAGVGLEGFLHNGGDYVRTLGALEFADFIVEKPKLVHNTYLQLLAETGIVGLALYLTVIAVSVGCAWRATVRFERAGNAAMVSLGRAVLVAVLAVLATSFFISAGADRRAWILFAFGPALLGASERASG